MFRYLIFGVPSHESKTSSVVPWTERDDMTTDNGFGCARADVNSTRDENMVVIWSHSDSLKVTKASAAPARKATQTKRYRMQASPHSLFQRAVLNAINC